MLEEALNNSVTVCTLVSVNHPKTHQGITQESHSGYRESFTTPLKLMSGYSTGGHAPIH